MNKLLKLFENGCSTVADFCLTLLIINLGWVSVAQGASAAWAYGIAFMLFLLISSGLKAWRELEEEEGPGWWRR